MTTPVPDTFDFPLTCLAVGRQAARLGNLAAEVSQHALSVKLGDVDELKSRHLPRSQHVTRQIRLRFLAPASPPARCFDRNKGAGSHEAAAHVSEPVTVWESTGLRLRLAHHCFAMWFPTRLGGVASRHKLHWPSTNRPASRPSHADLPTSTCVFREAETRPHRLRPEKPAKGLEGRQ